MRESEPESIISGSFFLREDAERSRARGGGNDPARKQVQSYQQSSYA